MCVLTPLLVGTLGKMRSPQQQKVDLLIRDDVNDLCVGCDETPLTTLREIPQLQPEDHD